MLVRKTHFNVEINSERSQTLTLVEVGEEERPNMQADTDNPEKTKVEMGETSRQNELPHTEPIGDVYI